MLWTRFLCLVKGSLCPVKKLLCFVKELLRLVKELWCLVKELLRPVKELLCLVKECLALAQKHSARTQEQSALARGHFARAQSPCKAALQRNFSAIAETSTTLQQHSPCALRATRLILRSGGTDTQNALDTRGFCCHGENFDPFPRPSPCTRTLEPGRRSCLMFVPWNPQ